jgi:hypothetical protein
MNNLDESSAGNQPAAKFPMFSRMARCLKKKICRESLQTEKTTDLKSYAGRDYLA